MANKVQYTTENFVDARGGEHVLLVLNPESRFPFKIGVGKCKRLLENLEVVKQFVADHSTKAEDDEQPKAKASRTIKIKGGARK